VATSSAIPSHAPAGWAEPAGSDQNWNVAALSSAGIAASPRSATSAKVPRDEDVQPGVGGGAGGSGEAGGGEDQDHGEGLPHPCTAPSGMDMYRCNASIVRR
jgi:hypothetical protein